MQMPEMLELKFPSGDVWLRTPIIGTIIDCEPTDSGWRGVLPDGVFSSPGPAPGRRWKSRGTMPC